jgi:MFS superfamily sulfate permease-like transporter
MVGIATSPTYESFLLSIVLAGLLQIVLGKWKAGVIGEFIPSAVIKGMMAAIGLILIMKQAQHLVGYDKDFEGDEGFEQAGGENTFTGLQHALENITPGAALIGFVSIGILMLWEIPWFKKNRFTSAIPASLVAVVFGTSLNYFWMSTQSAWVIFPEHLVSIPVATSAIDFFSFFTFPDFTAIGSQVVWINAATICAIASIESLLGLEAVDKMDPKRRISPPNKELVAQGVGNTLSGLLGGLPITSVVVRSSANLQAGAKSRMSTVYHGIFLLLSVVLIPDLLNYIPLATLAAVLIFVGFKLTKISIYKEMYQQGFNQFLPFVVTVIAIIGSNLLKGVVIGILVGVYFIIRTNFTTTVRLVQDGDHFLLRFGKQVTFLNKAILKKHLTSIADGSKVLIDDTQTSFMDPDIVEIMRDFSVNIRNKDIRVTLKKNGRLRDSSIDFFPPTL